MILEHHAAMRGMRGRLRLTISRAWVAAGALPYAPIVGGVVVAGVLAFCATAQAKTAQAITFTSSPPLEAVAGGGYEASAISSSGLPVQLYASGGCSFTKPTPDRVVRPKAFEVGAPEAEGPAASPAVVHFVAASECVLRAEVAPNAEYEYARAIQQFALGLDPTEQIWFISTPPGHARVGERSYEPVVSSSAGIEVFLYTTTPSVCELRLENEIVRWSPYVHFVHEGTCTIGAGQASLPAASEAEQSFTVSLNTSSRTIAPEISWRAPARDEVGALDTVWARNHSGPEPVLSSATPSVCTVTRAQGMPQGGTSASVRSIKSGTCTIVARVKATTTIRDVQEERETLEYVAGKARRSFRVIPRRRGDGLRLGTHARAKRRPGTGRPARHDSREAGAWTRVSR